MFQSPDTESAINDLGVKRQECLRERMSSRDRQCPGCEVSALPHHGNLRVVILKHTAYVVILALRRLTLT